MLVVIALHDADGHSEVGNTLEVVQRPIQRVDDPGELAVASLFSRFFRQNSMVWVGFADLFNNNRLGGAIDVGDKIVSAFFLYLELVGPIHTAGQKVCGFSCGA